MAKSRKKSRTHVRINDDALPNVPRSFVVKTGKVSNNIAELVQDIRRTMQPNTASRLKERKTNKLRDFVHVASQLHVTHLILLSKTVNGPLMRMARLPHGPTLTFSLDSFSLRKDILALQNRPVSDGIASKYAPLVILNHFAAFATKPENIHLKLMTTMFQNMFPSIDVQTVKLTDIRRVVIFNYIPESNQVEFRHYLITVKVSGISKSIKTIIQSEIPDLTKCNDISDYILRGAFASESDVEDAGESNVILPQHYIGKNNKQSEQRSIRLQEIGPRMILTLQNLQAGLCTGEVLYRRK